jgi:2,3-bisphosphoglycerate-dependent phosphoglycerate mutase
MRHRGVTAVRCSPLGRARATAAIVAKAIGLAEVVDEGLREAAFGVEEGTTMGDWFPGWIKGDFVPEGGESFAALRARAVAALNRALAGPSPVLVVAHGALFRAVRVEMGLEGFSRTANAMPLWCEPGQAPGQPWTLTPATDLAR